MSDQDQTPARKRSGCFHCFGVAAALFVLLVAVSVFVAFNAKAELRRADELWDAGQRAEATAIYTDELQYVNRPRRAEIYTRIVTQHYDSGDPGGALEYAVAAIEDGVTLSFGREDLDGLVAQARGSLAEQERGRRSPKPAAGGAAAIAPEVAYRILDEQTQPGVKRSVDVELAEPVSEETLEAIAKALKAADPAPYERTFIGYYLKGMEPSSSAYWATTHYAPTLEVRIHGLTPEAVSELSELSEVTDGSGRDEIGRWLDETPFVGGRIVIYREGEQVLMERTFQDGSRSVKEVLESESPLGRRFSAAEGSSTGDHWIIDANGDLQAHDDEGWIATSKPLD